MSVFILGDIHGHTKLLIDWLDKFAEPGDTLIQVGDFGAGFIHSEKIKHLAYRFEEKNCKLLVIRGNHDNPSLFDTKVGGVEFLCDTTRMIEGKKFLFLGGAVSIDRQYREQNRDWWSGERYSYNENFLKGVERCDYVVSHTCPIFAKPLSCINNIFVERLCEVDPTLSEDLLKEGKDMELTYNLIKETNNIKAWYFGHFHTSSKMEYDGVNFQCLDIDELITV